MGGRLRQLDGLRGLAALVVVIFHFLSAFAPNFIPDQTDTPYVLADTPFGIFFNGPFSVSIFFVLSGFVVSNAAAKRRSPIYLNLALRYVRLAVPVLFSVIFAWMLLELMPTATLSLDAIMPHTWLNWTYQGDIPSLFSAIRHGILTVFIRGNSNFNNVLWTMQIELLGSFALYLIYGSMLGWMCTATLLMLGLACCTGFFTVAYLGFVLGALIRDAWTEGRVAPAPSLLVVAGVLLGFSAHGFAQRMGLGWLPSILTPGENNSILPPVAAALIMAGLLYSRIGKVFERGPFQFLGRISFPLYLVHVPIIYTVFATLYVDFLPGRLGLALLFLFFLSVVLVVALLFEILFDAPTLRLIANVREKYWMRSGKIVGLCDRISDRARSRFGEHSKTSRVAQQRRLRSGNGTK